MTEESGRVVDETEKRITESAPGSFFFLFLRELLPPFLTPLGIPAEWHFCSYRL